jgi:hypothetical protein
MEEQAPTFRQQYRDLAPRKKYALTGAAIYATLRTVEFASDTLHGQMSFTHGEVYTAETAVYSAIAGGVCYAIGRWKEGRTSEPSAE